jgi:hypothetical protein
MTELNNQPGYAAESSVAGLPTDLDRLDNLNDFELADGEPDPRGDDLIGRDGEKIGKITELLASPSTRRAYYAVVDGGRELNNRRIVVPLADMTFKPDDNQAHAPYVRSQIANAPEYLEAAPNYAGWESYWRKSGPPDTASGQPTAPGQLPGYVGGFEPSGTSGAATNYVDRPAAVAAETGADRLGVGSAVDRNLSQAPSSHPPMTETGQVVRDPNLESRSAETTDRRVRDSDPTA